MSSRPRVFYVVGSLEADDTGDEVVTILGRLSRAAFDPRVITLGGHDDLRERMARNKVRVYSLGLSGPLGVAWSVWKVRGLLRSMDADVVHGFGPWGGAVAELAAPKGCAVVRSVDGPPDPPPGLDGRVLAFLERRASGRAATHFLVAADAARQVVARHYGARDVTVVPTSLDLSAVRERVAGLDRDGARVHLGLAPDDVLFVCLTSFESRAAMGEILRGVAVARRELAGIRLFLVGSGRHEAWSRGMAEELRLDDAVVFLGRGVDVDAVWAGADVVVDASQRVDWCRDALAARAVGLPVVKRVEGMAEGGLTDGARTPRVSGPADWFGSDLVRLADSADVRERVRVAGRDDVDAHDVAHVTDRLGVLYESLGATA